MDDISNIILYMAPWPVYDKIGSVASFIAAVVTPTLLIFAIVFRALETQLDNFEGQSRWASAIKDFMLYGSLISLYYLIGNALADYFNAVYAALGAGESSGGLGASLSAVTDKLANYIEKAETIVSQDESIFDALGNAGASAAGMVSYGFYYLTLVAVAFFTIFLRLAFAIAFGLVYVWGLIVLPLAITQNFRLLKGWGIFAGAVLLWPVIEAIILSLSLAVFDAAIPSLSANFDTAEATKAGAYAVFAILNLLLIAIMIAAPLVAERLVSNQSAVSAIALPFGGAALAASAGAYRILRDRVVPGYRRSAPRFGGSNGQGDGFSPNDGPPIPSPGSTTPSEHAPAFTRSANVANTAQSPINVANTPQSQRPVKVTYPTNNESTATDKPHVKADQPATSSSPASAAPEKPSLSTSDTDVKTKHTQSDELRKQNVKNYFKAKNANMKLQR
ncbi:MAG TPA: hypothetical protein ENK06_03660 [Gammaproteobacteria bacterium]|nr:hypothetical protein [Gammaproteobacteria bacterium]